MLVVLARCIRPDYAIAGYPEYGTDTAQLDAQQRRELTRAADEILSSQFTRLPVRAFLVIGNADKALRKAVPERAAFEQEISTQRAEAGREALLKELTRLAGGPAIRNLVRHQAVGIGNSRPRFAHASSEAQMRQNRRIEIVIARCPVSDPCCCCAM
jgi:flagellar motor protein MotB